ncbi:Cell division control protein 2 [Sesamum alatum]|uniref:Cell division control protein 2 n=1 Tax=Sesamum alatum TaxID=300844 RepID=A0AAE2C9W9_9LAMI|nr:Cell division control protein 2 [Sesamum alatum]
MDLYTRRRCIGYGASGEIYSGFHSDTHEPVLLREVRLHDARDGIPTNLIREISFLQEIKHENILRILDVINFDDENGIFLVYESPGRELQNLSSVSETGLDPDSIKRYLHQILLAVAFLHSHKTVHQDLRPENVFVDIDNKHLKVADLGLGRALGGSFEEDICTPSRRRFMAPELLMNSPYCSYAIDMWSVGCIFAQMLTGTPLFECLTVLHPLVHAFRLMGVPTEETWPGITRLYELLPHHKKPVGKNLKETFPDLEPEGFDLLSYADFEMKNNFVNHARNVWDRATQLLPRVDQLWYNYIHIEGMLGNVAGARQIVQRWMKWAPDQHGWVSYINFELRNNEVERARSIFERFVDCHPTVSAWIRFAEFEMKNGEIARARNCYERAVDKLGDDEEALELFMLLLSLRRSARR